MNNKQKFWRVNILSFILRIAWLDVLFGRKCYMKILYDSTISNQYFGPIHLVHNIKYLVSVMKGLLRQFTTWISHKFHVIFKFNTSGRSKVREFKWIQYKDFWLKSCMTLTSNRENWLKVVIAHPLLIWALCGWILSQIWKGDW